LICEFFKPQLPF